MHVLRNFRVFLGPDVSGLLVLLLMLLVRGKCFLGHIVQTGTKSASDQTTHIDKSGSMRAVFRADRR